VRYNDPGRNVAWDSETINEPRTRWKPTLIVVGVFALLSALSVVLDWVVRAQTPDHLSVPWMLVVFSGAFAITAAFAVWTAGSLGLPSFLLLAPISARRRWARFAVFGVGAGVFIYLSNGMLYLTTVGAAFRPAPAYGLNSHLEVFALSARAALSEETMFRLFAIPFLVSIGMRFYGWRPSFGFESGPGAPSTQPVRTPRRLIIIALIVSAFMFGMAHGTNPVAASLFGIVLGVAFLRGGWESAVTAHFLGNYLLFVGLYL
jgi:membrane protease YdiL (CAAX protease family)